MLLQNGQTISFYRCMITSWQFIGITETVDIKSTALTEITEVTKETYISKHR